MEPKVAMDSIVEAKTIRVSSSNVLTLLVTSRPCETATALWLRLLAA